LSELQILVWCIKTAAGLTVDKTLGLAAPPGPPLLFAIPSVQALRAGRREREMGSLAL